MAPWPKKQATAILVKAKRTGDTRLAAKAKKSLGKTTKRKTK